MYCESGRTYAQELLQTARLGAVVGHSCAEGRLDGQTTMSTVTQLENSGNHLSQNYLSFLHHMYSSKPQ